MPAPRLYAHHVAANLMALVAQFGNPFVQTGDAVKRKRLQCSDRPEPLKVLQNIHNLAHAVLHMRNVPSF